MSLFLTRVVSAFFRISNRSIQPKLCKKLDLTNFLPPCSFLSSFTMPPKRKAAQEAAVLAVEDESPVKRRKVSKKPATKKEQTTKKQPTATDNKPQDKVKLPRKAKQEKLDSEAQSQDEVKPSKKAKKGKPETETEPTITDDKPQDKVKHPRKAKQEKPDTETKSQDEVKPSKKAKRGKPDTQPTTTDVKSQDKVKPPRKAKQEKPDIETQTQDEVKPSKNAKQEKADTETQSEDEVKSSKKAKQEKADTETESDDEVKPSKKAKQEKADTETQSEDQVKPSKKSKRGKADTETQSEDEVKLPKKAKKGKSGTETQPAPSNATSTNWDQIDFTCNKKNPNKKGYNLKVTSWNIAGLRAWLKKGGMKIIDYDQPDIFCLQETKCNNEKLPKEVKDIPGYHDYWVSSEKDGYAGVAVYTKIKPENVVYGIGKEDFDIEGRCITLEFEGFYLVNVYVPNAGRKLVTLPKRLEWNDQFEAYIKSLDQSKPVIICGDMNVAHTEIDLANPKTNQKNAGFTKEERDGMTHFLQRGYVDTYRHLYPDVTNSYTFWSFMSNARAKNVGWRLDYFIVSERIIDKVCDCVIQSKVYGSDHCPISLFISV